MVSHLLFQYKVEVFIFLNLAILVRGDIRPCISQVTVDITSPRNIFGTSPNTVTYFRLKGFPTCRYCLYLLNIFGYTNTLSRWQVCGPLSSKHIAALTSFIQGINKFKQQQIQQILPWDDRSQSSVQCIWFPPLHFEDVAAAAI